MTRASRARGATVIEAAVALTVGLLVVHASLLALRGTHRAHARLTREADLVASLRLGRLVPRRELRHALPGVDWTVGGDSLSLRAFRGTALVCPGAAPPELVVSYRGDRLPEPEKDSVALVLSDGRRHLAALEGVGVAHGPCAGHWGAPWTWRIEPFPDGDVVLARLFERGSYHLADGALRYRRGGSGRQPLTPEVWSSSGSRWLTTGDRLGFQYVPSGAADPRWSGFLAWRAGR